MPSRAPQHRPPQWRPYVKPASTNVPYYRTNEWKNLRAACLQRDRFRCVAPECKTKDRGQGGRLISDHIIERKLGGPDTLGNLQTLCASCDNKKHGYKGYRM